MIKTGLYIHIPFCRSKCSYCDFLSFINNFEEAQNQYVEYLIKELDLYADDMKERVLDTIYLGGGTPSLLCSKQLERLFDSIYKKFNVLSESENTIEINPGTVNREWISHLKSIGINRASIGLQTSNDNVLKILNRQGNFADYLNTVNNLYMYGITNVSTDLMLGLPGLSLKESLADAKKLVELGMKHVSAYSLIIHDSCPIYKDIKKGEIVLPNEEMERENYHLVSDYLRKEGYERYETSNFAKQGYRSKHNCKYWNLDEYLGIGLGSSSLMNNERFKNQDSLEIYYSELDKGNKPAVSEYIMNLNDMMSEYSFLKIRTSDGISLGEFSKKFGKDFFDVFNLDEHIANHLVRVSDYNIVLTDKGQDLSNIVEMSLLI